GAGRIFDQGAKLVKNAVDSGSIFTDETWPWILEPCEQGGALHLVGLWSDGNVHSHVDHAYALLERAVRSGVKRIRLHILLDGRDVGETTALDYVEPLEARLAELQAEGVDAKVASGGGRMITTMDRYDADWSIVERGWRAHVQGDARGFARASEAIETFRTEDPKVVDQYLPPFVVTDATGAVGPVQDGDAVVLFNFRGDRAIELTRAFETPEGEDFPFDRGRLPRVRFAGMMEYDGDLKLPSRYLVAPPAIERTLGEFLARNGYRQLACSETQKFGHVTYFFNGNRSEAFDETLERHLEIPSDRVEFSEKPKMKAEEITDAVLEQLDAFQPHFVRINYANGDMVGHTGVLSAAVEAMESVDLAVGRLIEGVLERSGICVILADHGNCEQMFERDKKTGGFKPGSEPGTWKPCTTHTLNPVPCVVVGAAPGLVYRWSAAEGTAGLANVAASCLNLLGLEAPADFLPGFLEVSAS
ncbi:MAG: 2,3-bisphosphoglycerate-independent phosphoglycerate mutase, partial [Myxococcota bacterium]|nr:2,3-bisphosphoglycerate-independent phosphoglycerate mutase [Myxococcota bacterium]